MAASSYEEALRRLLAHEGGYSNHPADPGGPTKYGITLADYRRHMRPNATPADLRAMQVAEAQTIYRAKYWNALACDALPAGLDYAVFDYGVNSGTARAAKVLAHLVGRGPGGAGGAGIDQATLALVRAREPARLIAAICDERLAFLRRLRTWPVFGKGWERRIAEVRGAALRMAGAPADAPIPSTPGAPGKGVVPIPRAAQKGTASVVVAAGTAAAQQAHAAGLGPASVVAIVLVTAALAICAWAAWHAWRRHLQETPAAASTT